MEKIVIKNRIEYWKKTASHDYETMAGLFKIKRYSDCLFYGHIILEKILKAHTVMATGEEAPPIHNLTRDDKFVFYKQCDRKYTEDNFKKIIKIYKELCGKLK